MQISYGLDTVGDFVTDTYQTADVIDANDDWARVMSVKVSLLMNTVNEVNPQQQAYSFMGTAVTNPGDRMLRRQWDSYVTIRNQVL